jgi:O-antigen biosynthesis protein
LNPDYKSWISRWGTTEEALAAMRLQVAGFEHSARTSLLLVLSDPDETWIKVSVDSVLRQVYPNVELCVCTNGSQRAHVLEILEGYADDERIKVRHLPGKHSQADAYNVALSMATGEFVALLSPGDELAPDAAFRAADFLQSVTADVIYSDEDQTDAAGRRSNPVFKPYWSPELLLSTPYAGRLCVIRRNVLDSIGGYREGFEGAEEHDVLLRLSEKTDRIYHLPGVLYHRRKLPGPVRPEKDPVGSLRAVEEALARRREDASVQRDPLSGTFRVARHLAGRLKVSVIVSISEGEPDASFLEELERKTSYPVHQLLVASGEEKAYPTAHNANQLFPTRAMNLAAGRADGEYLVFTTDRARILDPGWLPELLTQAQRPSVGAVGCKLLDPDGSLLHGGSQVDLSGLAGYPSEPASEASDGPLVVDQAFNCEAASAECMMVRKAAFDVVGGFDEERLPTAFCDLDLCFRLQEEGLRNVYTPYASLACARPDFLPSEREIAYMWRRWWANLVRLLYYQRPPVHRLVPRAVDEDILMTAISS